ncbi:aldo/keto reductase [Micromonospora globbae]|uniref:Aldo/keto reductase n=1 Tax=Micromonospora globbae TaxID=1894969 RepID=A0A420F401_9ACTN|nr:aldo/keto reductase [Micromonospora globbae]RKF27643.1 aldo/keto reductase [Micromonospora globbae]
MKYRLLGPTGVWVSELSLGAMTFGGTNHPVYSTLGALGREDTERMVGTALDAGINFIDTADVYSDGESEELLGHALRHRRDDVVLATKVYAPTGPGPNDVGWSRLHVTRALDTSLRRLGTDHIDLYQLHNIDPVTPFEEVLAALDDAVHQGKVRYIGCANLAAWQISKALGVSALRNLNRFVSVQAYYSLVGRDVERDLLPMAQAENLAVTVWSPLAGGFLTGKISRDGGSTGPSRRTAEGGQDFPPVDRERGHEVLDVLRTVAGRHGVSIPRVAIAWLLAQPAVTSVIVGARTTDQLTDNIAASGLTLSEQDLAELDAVSRQAPAYPNWIHEMFAPVRNPNA